MFKFRRKRGVVLILASIIAFAVFDFLVGIGGNGLKSDVLLGVDSFFEKKNGERPLSVTIVEDYVLSDRIFSLSSISDGTYRFDGGEVVEDPGGEFYLETLSERHLSEKGLLLLSLDFSRPLVLEEVSKYKFFLGRGYKAPSLAEVAEEVPAVEEVVVEEEIAEPSEEVPAVGEVVVEVEIAEPVEEVPVVEEVVVEVEIAEPSEEVPVVEEAVVEEEIAEPVEEVPVVEEVVVEEEVVEPAEEVPVVEEVVVEEGVVEPEAGVLPVLALEATYNDVFELNYFDQVVYPDFVIVSADHVFLGFSEQWIDQSYLYLGVHSMPNHQFLPRIFPVLGLNALEYEGFEEEEVPLQIADKETRIDERKNYVREHYNKNIFDSKVKKLAKHVYLADSAFEFGAERGGDQFYVLGQTSVYLEEKQVFIIDLIFSDQVETDNLDLNSFAVEDVDGNVYLPTDILVSDNEVLLVVQAPKGTSLQLVDIKNLYQNGAEVKLDGYLQLDERVEQYEELTAEVDKSYLASIEDDIVLAVDEFEFGPFNTYQDSDSTVAIQIAPPAQLKEQCLILAFADEMKKNSGDAAIDVNALSLLSNSEGHLPLRKDLIKQMEESKGKRFIGHVYFDDLEADSSGNKLLYLNVSIPSGLQEGNYLSTLSLEFDCDF